MQPNLAATRILKSEMPVNSPFKGVASASPLHVSGQRWHPFAQMSLSLQRILEQAAGKAGAGVAERSIKASARARIASYEIHLVTHSPPRVLRHVLLPCVTSHCPSIF